MPDIEKVIKGLECCMLSYKDGCDECPYVAKGMCQELLGEHALALLKAQEPRVMTLAEAKTTYVLEFRLGKMSEIGASLNDVDIDPDNYYYGHIYRVWTSRPTDEQRKGVPWNGQPE